MRSRPIPAAFLVSALCACTAALPEVSSDRFACVDDARDPEDGELQCDETDACDRGVCAPRLSCTAPGATAPTCVDELTRCELIANGETASVRCQPGLHTVTSTRPADPGACACDDGAVCVTWAEGAGAAAEAYPLFVLPDGGPLPAAVAAGGDRPESRLCLLPCSGELDCPAHHTCRAAAVAQDELLSRPASRRHTIGVCFPDVPLAGSSSTAPSSPRRDLTACASEGDCLSQGSNLRCQATIVPIPDHPTAPAGDAWVGPERAALVPRCVEDFGGGMVPVGVGCRPTDLCERGVCNAGRCAEHCDPNAAEPCSGARSCVQFTVERIRPGGQTPVRDRLWLCAR